MHEKKAISQDLVGYYPGLLPKGFEGCFDHPKMTIKDNCLVYPIFCDYGSFQNLNKSDDFKGLYIYRDPREHLVSTYYSWKVNHPGGHPYRNTLMSFETKEQQYKFVLDKLLFLKTYESMVSWVENCNDDRIWIIKFEDFFKNAEAQDNSLKKLFKYFGFEISESLFLEISNKFSFKNLSNGRNRNEININHHYRSGGSSTWKTELSLQTLDYFYEKTGNTIDKLKYEK